MKCRNCGFENTPDSTHCKRCNTMIRKPDLEKESGGRRALLQVLLFIIGTFGIVGVLWIVMHDLLHIV